MKKNKNIDIASVQIDPIAVSNGANFEFSLNYNGKTIKGGLLVTFYKNEVGEDTYYEFHHIDGYNWIYYIENSDKDYIDDKRTQEQKQIEKAVIDKISTVKYAKGGNVGNCCYSIGGL